MQSNQSLAYATIVGNSVGKRCGYMIHTLEKLDVAFVQAVKGQTVPQSLASPKKFDGIVAQDDATWQGWGDLRLVTTAPGANHLSIQTSSLGIAHQKNALESIGVWTR